MKLTVTWARRTLRAVNELIGQYKDGTHDDLESRCPLCVVARRLGKLDEKSCDRCPWVILKGKDCFFYERDPIPLRLRRLYGWRVRLKNIIEKGGKL